MNAPVVESTREFDLGADGVAFVRGALPPEACDRIARHVDAGPPGAGTRCLLAAPWCADLAAQLMRHPRVREALPAKAVAVQCTLFEKSAARNWLVPIHQDLSIPVAHRVDHPALTGWSLKEGGLFVQPPDDVLAQLLAVRVHVDACGEDAGPLKVVPGSHRHGRVPPDVAALAGRRSAVAVPARRGDALLMRPLVLHASSRSSGTSRRRVLHILFGPRGLPLGLPWPDPRRLAARGT